MTTNSPDRMNSPERIQDKMMNSTDKMKIDKYTQTLYPLLQPPNVPSIVSVPFNMAGNVVKDLSSTVNRNVKASFGSLSNFMADSEIRYLITQLTKDFIAFVGDIVKEVGEEAMNEFLQIFFQMLLDAGSKMINGFVNVTIKLLMSLLGEVPVAGGVADFVITAVTSFNDIVRSITPIIKSTVKAIVTGINLINKTSDAVFNNPALNSLNDNFSKFNAKVFGGVSFFTFLENMFGSMKDTVNNIDVNNLTNTLTATTDSFKKNLMNVGENAFGDLQQNARQMNETMQNAAMPSSPGYPPAPSMPSMPSYPSAPYPSAPSMPSYPSPAYPSPAPYAKGGKKTKNNKKNRKNRKGRSRKNKK